jgi:hypothetical protein
VNPEFRIVFKTFVGRGFEDKNYLLGIESIYTKLSI